MATKQNTSRQNFGNPFTAGSSLVQGEALAAPKFVDYSQFFDTSPSEGLAEANKALFGAIALANEKHALNMENMIPKDFDITKLASGAVEGTYAMLDDMRNKYSEYSRTATNKRGTKEGIAAQMEMNRMKMRLNRHYANNVEYNSIMVEHDKNKGQYSTAWKHTEDGGKDQLDFIKFSDPDATITYRDGTMWITAADNTEITFEDFKKLEPTMIESEMIQGIETLSATVGSNSLNGKKVTDETIWAGLGAVLAKSRESGEDWLKSLMSLAVDGGKEVGADMGIASFFNAIKNPEGLTEEKDRVLFSQLKKKYLNENGNWITKFEDENGNHDPHTKAQYEQNLENDIKKYYRDAMQNVRDENYREYEAKVEADNIEKDKREIENYKAKRGYEEGIKKEYFALDTRINRVREEFLASNNNLPQLEAMLDESKPASDGRYFFLNKRDANGNDIPGEYTLHNNPPGDKIYPEWHDLAGQEMSPNAIIHEFSTKGTGAEKKEAFATLMNIISGDVNDAYSRETGGYNTHTWENDVVEENEETEIDNTPVFHYKFDSDGGMTEASEDDSQKIMETFSGMTPNDLEKASSKDLKTLISYVKSANTTGLKVTEGKYAGELLVERNGVVMNESQRNVLVERLEVVRNNAVGREGQVDVAEEIKTLVGNMQHAYLNVSEDNEITFGTRQRASESDKKRLKMTLRTALGELLDKEGLTDETKEEIRKAQVYVRKLIDGEITDVSNLNLDWMPTRRTGAIGDPDYDIEKIKEYIKNKENID